MHREPRVHVLLSALDDGGGYRYHGIAMRAQPRAASHTMLGRNARVARAMTSEVLLDGHSMVV